jgi:hypothetical protein
MSDVDSRDRVASIRARAILAWAVGFYLLGQLLFLFLREYTWPALGDAEYGRKLTSLRSRLDERPRDRPLVVLLGSSRVAMGVRPDCLWTEHRGHEPAVVFNYGICGAGPVLELVCLKRLLQDGIRPDCVMVEVWPLLLSRHYYDHVAVLMLDRGIDRYRWRDLSIVSQFHPDPKRWRRQWSGLQRLPWFSYRYNVLNECAASFVTKEMCNDGTYRGLDGWGFLQIEGHLEHPSEQRLQQLVTNARTFATTCLDPFEISPVLDRAQRELLKVARAEKIPVVLMMMPDPEGLREWYRNSPTGPEAGRYVRRLAREYGAPMVDMRSWMPDDCFADADHLCLQGAASFTCRFEKDVLLPWLAGELREPDSGE